MQRIIFASLTILLGLAAPVRADESTLPFRFVDAAETVGLNFSFEFGSQKATRLLHTTAGGGGWLDYNNDGLLDAYFVNGAPVTSDADPAPLHNRLFRHNPDGSFTDVTDEGGVGDTAFGMGCAFGDFDNDGDVDIFVSNYGPNVLYRNNGDGTFTDVTAAAGVAGTP